MKHYSLKNKEMAIQLQHDYCKTDSNFVLALQEVINADLRAFNYGGVITMVLKTKPEVLSSAKPSLLVSTHQTAVLTFTKNDVNVEDVFSPDEWNDYPLITPPERVFMRLEWVTRDENGKPCREGARAYFEAGQWFTGNGEALVCEWSGVRYRPWSQGNEAVGEDMEPCHYNALGLVSPTGANPYPAITPPEDVWCFLHFVDADGEEKVFKARFIEGQWVNNDEAICQGFMDDDLANFTDLQGKDRSLIVWDGNGEVINIPEDASDVYFCLLRYDV